MQIILRQAKGQVIILPLKKNENKPKNNSSKEENIVWGAEHEKILVEWADKAMCHQWLRR